MSLRIALAAFLAFTAAVVACHHRRSSSNVTPKYPNDINPADIEPTECPSPPAIGPRSHLEIVRSTASDSALRDSGIGRIIALLRWSSDSVTRETPVGAVVRVTSVRTGIVTERRFDEDSVNQDGYLMLSVTLPAGDNLLRVSRLRARGLDTTLTVRNRYTDTLRVFLQSVGVTVCL